LYIADESNHRIRTVTAGGVIATLAGTGQAGYSGDGGPSAAAQINSPNGVAVDAAGMVYIADTGNHRIRAVTPGGVILTLAGTGVRGYSGDGGLGPSAQLDSPSDVTLDSAGNLYISDTGNNCIRRLTPGGAIGTVAGNGLRGFAGDSGQAAAASLDTPRGLAFDNAGNLYVADAGNRRVRVISPQGIIVTAGAGAGLWGSPRGVAVTAAGDLFVADAATNQIGRLDASGALGVAAGTGQAGFSGDGGPAASAQLNAPNNVALDAAGNLYIADLANNRIRKLTPAAVAVDITAVPPAQPLTVSNLASQLQGPVAPGEILSVSGSGLGPQTAVAAQLAGSGVLANQIGGTQVLFNGSPAALLYAQDKQVNVQAPYSIAGLAAVDLQVIYNGALAARTTVAVTDTSPALFTVGQATGPVLAFNEDGTQNSADNPAARGSLVTLFATGEGQTTPAGVGGVLAGSPFPLPVAPVSVKIGGYAAEIQFAGEAPGTVGTLQVNVRIPGGYAPAGILPIVLAAGNAISQGGVTIAVQ
jgi:uncharacterized protein (TIGR03437 family)